MGLDKVRALMMPRSLLTALLLLVLAAPACRPFGEGKSGDEGGERSGGRPKPGVSTRPASRYVPLTLLGTNDIHGGVEPSLHKTTGSLIGGLDLFAGIVRSIRKSVGSQGGGVLVVDAGDQFQGTLVSNFNEGELVFKLFDEIGYDAVVPGNHDYDFGPRGWLKDRATDPGENPREVIEGLASAASFPLISANTYLRDSLVDAATGAPVSVASNSCAVAGGVRVDWARARRPGFLKPYVIRSIQGVRVALIGLDNPSTANMTTASNVSDLCFRSPVDTYAEVAAELSGKADVFVLIVHGADSPGSAELSQWVRQMLRDRGARLDAVVAGHTHMIQKSFVDGVPIIQSGSGGERFGRIDFIFDRQEGRVDPARTRVVSGAAIFHDLCDEPRVDFCLRIPGTPGYNGLSYDEEPVELNLRASRLIRDARRAVAPIAARKLFNARSDLKRNRISESAMANLLTDVLRETSGAQIAFLNTGGIRDEIPAGEVTYEQLFKVLPFGNVAVVAKPMSTAKLLKLLQRSIETCGDYGALMQSGLRVRFTRDCARNKGATDPEARLLHVETIDGDVIYDEATFFIQAARQFRVATLDFLLDGGSGYSDFKGIPKVGELGILRERLADEFLNMSPSPEYSGSLDGRWEEVPAASAN